MLSRLLVDDDLGSYFHVNNCPSDAAGPDGRPVCACWSVFWPELRDEPGSPNDLRHLGWMVAVHNDYVPEGKRYTFWLISKGERCLKGEGTSDAVALDQIRKKISTERR